MKFEKNQRVVTPKGPGVFDGYGSPVGTTKPNLQWVLLDDGRFTPFRLDAEIRLEADDERRSE
jgi:hypothetical protein